MGCACVLSPPPSPPEKGQVLFQREGLSCAMGKSEEPNCLFSMFHGVVLITHFMSFLRGEGEQGI